MLAVVGGEEGGGWAAERDFKRRIARGAGVDHTCETRARTSARTRVPRYIVISTIQLTMSPARPIRDHLHNKARV